MCARWWSPARRTATSARAPTSGCSPSRAHPWKVNFCKFTNETRNGIEDATTHSGQTWIAAVNGTAAGGGYELALACDQILLVDDNSSAVSLPEVPLLGVLPGTGGLTRVIDKRRVRKDRADVFATRAEGIRGKQAVEWRLVDEVVPKRQWDEKVRERATAAAARSPPPDRRRRDLAPAAAARGDRARHQVPPRRGDVRPGRGPRQRHRLRAGGRRTRHRGARARARRRLLAAGHDPRARRPHPAAARQRAGAGHLGGPHAGRHRGRAGVRAGDRRALRRRTGWSTRSATTSSAR